MAPPQPIFVITGQLAAGKSTLARALVQRFPFGFHVDVDAIREMVASGLASPLEWTAETTRQFDLAVAGSVALARVYHRAGFAVAIEGAVDPAVVDRHLGAARLRAVRVGVVLHPPVAVALQRNRERRTKPFDPAILEGAIAQIDADLASEPVPAGWLTLDNADEPVEATADRVMALWRGVR